MDKHDLLDKLNREIDLVNSEVVDQQISKDRLFNELEKIKGWVKQL